MFEIPWSLETTKRPLLPPLRQAYPPRASSMFQDQMAVLWTNLGELMEFSKIRVISFETKKYGRWPELIECGQPFDQPSGTGKS